MRILVLAPQPFFSLRGTPIALLMLLESLAAKGHEIDMLTFAEGDPVEIKGVNIFRVADLAPLRGIRPGFSGKKAFADLLMTAMAIAILSRNRYDVIHAVEEMAYVARWLKPIFRVPYVFDLDSSIPMQIEEKYNLPGPIKRMLEATERGALRRATAAITCCPALERIARANAPELPVKTITDVSLLDGALIKQDDVDTSDARFDAPVAMYVGNLEHYQGLDLLMEGLARALPQRRMHLVVIGGASEDITRYKAKAADLGIGDVSHFLGPRPISALRAYLRAADIVVSPRLIGVNTPMKVYSYLDSGRPLLATALSTHTQVIGEDIAHLVAPTPEAMAQGLLHLTANPEAAKALAARAKERVKAEFSHAAFQARLSEFYETIVASRVLT
ncbi:glycosyltransferase family 4 protein [Shimia sp.]|uniref:glycosyltransferase family 4 protein n=1 Tax=Shimia sp. TaxID=1954381 RepID=UPI003BAD580E